MITNNVKSPHGGVLRHVGRAAVAEAVFTRQHGVGSHRLHAPFIHVFIIPNFVAQLEQTGQLGVGFLLISSVRKAFIPRSYRLKFLSEFAIDLR